jgi:hypothetical protein
MRQGRQDAFPTLQDARIWLREQLETDPLLWSEGWTSLAPTLDVGRIKPCDLRKLDPIQDFENFILKSDQPLYTHCLQHSVHWSERLLYKTRGFQSRELAEAWISPAQEVPVQVQYNDPPQPRARVTYLKPRRSRVVIISDSNPLPPLASPLVLPDS